LCKQYIRKKKKDPTFFHAFKNILIRIKGSLNSTVKDESLLLAKTRLLIERDFSLDPSEMEGTSAWEELEDHVARVVAYLVDSNMGDFLNMLYIMDVDEALIKKAISESSPENVCHHIARIIIDREKAKVLTRQQYRSDEEGDW